MLTFNQLPLGIQFRMENILQDHLVHITSDASVVIPAAAMGVVTALISEGYISHRMNGVFGLTSENHTRSYTCVDGVWHTRSSVLAEKQAVSDAQALVLTSFMLVCVPGGVVRDVSIVGDARDMASSFEAVKSNLKK